jgi:hypothetical protein
VSFSIFVLYADIPETMIITWQLRCLALLLVLIALGDGVTASTFQPNCTLPPGGMNYVSGPNARGTLSILWNCISIFILCTWSIQHLNIPATRPHTTNFWQKTWWTILDSRTKIKWMILTMLMPEYIMGKALNELLAALSVPELSCFERAKLDTEWTISHSYFANMGGYVLDFTDCKQLPATEAEVADGDALRTGDIAGNPKA